MYDNKFLWMKIRKYVIAFLLFYILNKQSYLFEQRFIVEYNKTKLSVV